MKTLSEHLIQYSHYHRVRQNILTHFFGIPLIVIALLSFLSMPLFTISTLAITPALLLWLGSSIFYLRLDGPLGVLMSVINALCLLLASWLYQLPFSLWLAGSAALFVVGWLLQFIGHYFEGRKPAFVDDLTGLIIGPLFVVTELAFILGFRQALAAEIIAASGPVRDRSQAKN